MKSPFPEGTISSFAPQSGYFFMSNFYPCKVTYEGITYPSTEHAFQAAKTMDHDLRMLIMRQPTPATAKKAGRGLVLRTDWNEVKFHIMREILSQKFETGGILAAKLRFTKEVELIEGNWWHDIIWGQCNCKRHNWEGENKLGIMLMEVRSELERAARPLSQGGVQTP